jgi:hypothetical protein
MKVQNPIIGRARGSAGGMTFCKNYDKNVARAKAFEVSNPKTQAQQTQRAFFADLTALCSDFSDDQLRFLFPSKPKTMSRRNALSKQIGQSYEVNGTVKTIDYADIDTLGNAPVMDFGVTTCEFSNGSINVVLDNSVKGIQALAGYDFVAAIVNETKGAVSLTTENGEVSDGSLIAAIPSGWEDTDSIHAIPLVTNSKNGAIAQAGFGTMFVAKRPARKND